MIDGTIAERHMIDTPANTNLLPAPCLHRGASSVLTPLDSRPLSTYQKQAGRYPVRSFLRRLYQYEARPKCSLRSPAAQIYIRLQEIRHNPILRTPVIQCGALYHDLPRSDAGIVSRSGIVCYRVQHRSKSRPLHFLHQAMAWPHVTTIQILVRLCSFRRNMLVQSKYGKVKKYW